MHIHEKFWLELSQNFGPNPHQLCGFKGGDKPLLVVDAQLGYLNQTTTIMLMKLIVTIKVRVAGMTVI